MWRVAVLLVACATLLTACGDGGGSETTVTVVEADLANFPVTSEALAEGEPIPPEFTADGGNASPPLSWTDVPPGTDSYAVVVDDPDAPTAEPFVHWVAYGIPSGVSSLPAGIEMGDTPTALQGGVQGTNSFGNQGYDGPAPPGGDPPHTYRFTVYALAGDPALEPGLTKDEFLERAAGSLIGRGSLVGTYQRQ